MERCIRELVQANLEVERSLSGDSDTLNPLAHDVEKCKSSAVIAMEIANKTTKNPMIEYDPVDRKTYSKESMRNPGFFPESEDRPGKYRLWDDRKTLDWFRKVRISISELDDISRLKAMRLAIAEGREAVVQFLVTQVGNNKARRALIAEAMDLAISASQLHILESLIKGEAGISNHVRLKLGHTPLIAALSAGNEDMVQLLLQHGADIETRCAEEITPLTHAVKSRDPNLVQLLLQNHPLVDERTSNWTPLHLAVHYGDREIVQHLLREDADIEALCPRELPKEVNAPDPPININLERLDTNGTMSEVKAYCTVLYRAVVQGDDKMVELLLDQGADIGAKNPGLASALSCAAEEQFEEIVELLLRKGANANKEDEWDLTPLHRAQYKLESDKVTRLLLSSEANVDARCHKKRTPLHYAAEKGNTLTTPLLLENGADIEAEDIAGNRPLHIAILYRSKEMVFLLVQRGADVTAMNGDGHNALTIATRDVEKQRKSPEIIEFLKEKSSNEFKVHPRSCEGMLILLHRIVPSIKNHHLFNLLFNLVPHLDISVPTNLSLKRIPVLLSPFYRYSLSKYRHGFDHFLVYVKYPNHLYATDRILVSIFSFSQILFILYSWHLTSLLPVVLIVKSDLLVFTFQQRDDAVAVEYL